MREVVRGDVSARRNVTISYTVAGSGPKLVLVHGSFSDHETNWTQCAAALESRFTVIAIARRGRGRTTATTDHSVEDEAEDVAAVIEEVGGPVAVLGHSHGALVALETALRSPHVEKLILYEPIREGLYDRYVDRFEDLAAAGDYDRLVDLFLRETLETPPDVVDALKTDGSWSDWIADAPTTLNDVRAACRYQGKGDRFRSVEAPALLLTGSESPQHLYRTTELQRTLRQSRTVVLQGQGHEGMTTAPELFVREVTSVLLGAEGSR
jgi:pimeloyl-ACP methyl ester carboxylesterase